MTPQSNKLLIQRFVDEVINGKDLAVIDRICLDGFIEHIPFPGQGPGREGLKQAVAMFHSAFPDLHWRTHEQIAEGGEGGTVVSRFTWSGTHRGSFMGIAPTGKRVEVWGIVIDVVREGRFAESRILMDTLGLLQQLGAIPAL